MQKQTVVVEILNLHPDDNSIPDDAKFVACIKDGEYGKMVVSGASAADCFQEIAISIHCLNEYRKTLPK